MAVTALSDKKHLLEREISHCALLRLRMVERKRFQKEEDSEDCLGYLGMNVFKGSYSLGAFRRNAKRLKRQAAESALQVRNLAVVVSCCLVASS